MEFIVESPDFFELSHAIYDFSETAILWSLGSICGFPFLLGYMDSGYMCQHRNGLVLAGLGRVACVGVYMRLVGSCYSCFLLGIGAKRRRFLFIGLFAARGRWQRDPVVVVLLLRRSFVG